MRTWANWRAAILGAITALVAATAAAGAVIYFGWFDVAASSAHLPPVRWVVHRVMIRSVAARSSGRAPARVPAAFAAAGYCIYRTHCQTCHGGPGTARDSWANGLNPSPPYLIDARTRFKPDELHWIVAKGVKMTAMPAWKASMNDRDTWAVVSFLESMPDLPAEAYKRWSSAGACPTGDEFGALLGTAPAVAPPAAVVSGRWPPGLAPTESGPAPAADQKAKTLSGRSSGSS